MQVRDGDGERVRRVERRGRDAQLQEHTHHLLNLLLLGSAVADDRLLDETRRVLGYLDSGALRRDEHDAAHLSELERGLGVDGEESLLDGAHVWTKLLNQTFDAVADFQEPRREALARSRLHRPELDETVAARVAVNHAPARSLAARINP